MTDEEWEEAYTEIARKDFERAIYKRCDEEDSKQLDREWEAVRFDSDHKATEG